MCITRYIVNNGSNNLLVKYQYYSHIDSGVAGGFCRFWVFKPLLPIDISPPNKHIVYRVQDCLHVLL